MSVFRPIREPARSIHDALLREAAKRKTRSKNGWLRSVPWYGKRPSPRHRCYGCAPRRSPTLNVLSDTQSAIPTMPPSGPTESHKPC